MRDQEIIGLQEAYLEVSEAQEEGRRARKRYKNAPSYDQVKAGIDAKEKATAERKAERADARRPLTPAERYEQEKAARKDKSGSFSQHRMSGSRGHGSEYQNTRSIREQLVSYLLDEGFASDEKSAEAIIGAMSEAWVESIMEQQTDPLKTSAEMSSLRNTAFGSKKFQDKIWISPSNPKGPNWDPKSVKTPGV